MSGNRDLAGPTRRPRPIAGGLAVGLVALLAVGCGPTQDSESSSQQAEQLAEQLQSTLKEEGLSVPSTDVLTSLYGDDGGVSCENVDGREHRAGLAGFGSYAIGRRAVMDPRVLDYDRAVISTYCPEELQDFEDAVEDLKAEETLPDQGN